MIGNISIVIIFQSVFIYVIDTLSAGKDSEMKLDTHSSVMLKAHNFYRSKEGASDMHCLKKAYFQKWSKGLAWSAKKVSQTCKYDHMGSSDIGQNLFAIPIPDNGSFDFREAIEAWYDEKIDYNYRNNSCKTTCGHYTQLVWATTKKVGCSYSICDPLTESGLQSLTYFVVCNYKPRGNEAEAKPYRKGKACSKCRYSKSCKSGLCSDSEEYSRKKKLPRKRRPKERPLLIDFQL